MVKIFQVIFKTIIFTVIFSCLSGSAQDLDQLIKRCIAEVNPDSVKSYIQEMDNMNRYTFEQKTRMLLKP